VRAGPVARPVDAQDEAGAVLGDDFEHRVVLGRAVHIHVKVHLGGTAVHTGQLFFADAVTAAAYRKAPYAARPSRDTRNAADSIFRNGGSRSLLHLRKSSTGYRGGIVVGVDRR
jgi:hypothetical protein